MPVSTETTAKTAPASFDNPMIKYDTADPAGALFYTADPAAMVVGDTVYLYTMHDEKSLQGKDYRMYDYRLWTSNDLSRWQNKDTVFRYSDFAWARGNLFIFEIP